MMSLTKNNAESDYQGVRCKKCGEPLLTPEKAYIFKQRREIRGAHIITHWFLCRECAKEESIPLCENKDSDPECEISKPGDPELRIKKLVYDPWRGETWCKSCGLVQEEVSITSLSGTSVVQYPNSKKPKNYNRTVQELADDQEVDWFNYSEDSLIITCKAGNNYNLLFRYPKAKIILI